MKRQWLSYLAGFLNDNNIFHIVISPGSRNAPLLLNLTNHKGLKVYSHVDERSAAYLALGMAQYLQSTVALVCTSGSALLNYGPALSEAYYQRIPILVLSADRSPEWIDQSDGQSIRQNNVFYSYIRKSFTLPVEVNHPDDEWFIWRSLSEAILYTKYPVPGPVHVNIPFREPLYDLELNSSNKPKSVNVLSSGRTLDDSVWKEIIFILQQKKRIMILAGLNNPDRHTTEILGKLAGYNHIIVLTDISSNQYAETFIRASDDIMTVITDNGQSDYYPEVLITFGGTIISKTLKNWLRRHPPEEHWHISIACEAPDTYQCLTKIIVSDINHFLKGLNLNLRNINSTYSKDWHDILEKINIRRNIYLEKSKFTDFKACWTISQNIPLFTSSG
jgi:2-succinyl-5-enolpyruvyl-6-hydroxy-3-cyclohexene-1-carboxylate synthase